MFSQGNRFSILEPAGGNPFGEESTALQPSFKRDTGVAIVGGQVSSAFQRNDNPFGTANEAPAESAFPTAQPFGTTTFNNLNSNSDGSVFITRNSLRNSGSPFGNGSSFNNSSSPFTTNNNNTTTESSTKFMFSEKQLPPLRIFTGKRVFLLVLLCFLFLVLPVSDFVVFPSCRSSSYYCISQMSVKWLDNESGRYAAFSSAKDVAELLGHLATDLSPYENSTDDFQYLLRNMDNDDPDAPPSYLETINTFSLDNVFQMGYWGYCKTSFKTGESTCSPCFGLDVPSAIVRDAGMQLGDVSNHYNPSVLGESFVTAYFAVLRSLRGIPGVAGEMINNALLVRMTSVTIPVMVAVEVGLSGLNLLIILFMVSMASFDRSFAYIKGKFVLLTTVMLCLQFLTMLVDFSIAAGQTEYIVKLAEVMLSSGIATVKFGYGSHLAWVKFLCSCIVFIMMLVLLVKKPWNVPQR